MALKRIACLAASIKNRGFCYAGKDLNTGMWIKPISDDEGHAISAYYRVVAPGDPAKVGDVLTMSVGKAAGHGYQTENYMHIQEHWQRLGTFGFNEALAMTDQPASLWGRGRSSTHGIRDDLSEAEANEFDFSLCLIEVSDLVVVCTDEGYGEVKFRTRARFSYRQIEYQLAITDPAHFSYEPGQHVLGHALLCCSLAEPYEWQDGSRHVSKLVAAIITRERLG